MLSGDHDYLRLILTARVYDVAVETPVTEASALSAYTKNHVLLKREDMQPIHSFKIRGAYNRMWHLSAEERRRGVITCSAGNHAQGVAMAAKKLGMRAVIVMPTCTPEIKWRNVQRLGADVLLYGDDFDAARVECERCQKLQQLIYIPPFDDPLVIAGQGTMGVEVVRQCQRWHAEQEASTSAPPSSGLDAIFCAVGGGGMVAGLCAYLKRIHPGVKIIGVEARDANAMHVSLAAGKRVTLGAVGLFADGAAVRSVGEETFRICSHPQYGVDEIVLVSNDEICAAIKDVFGDTRTVLEPAGALGVAGLKKWSSETNAEGQTLVAITSGANMSFDRLRFVAERARLGEQREALISVQIPERPGSFMRLIEVIYPRAVTEFSYRFGDASRAHIIMSFEFSTTTDRHQELQGLFKQLSAQDMQATDLTGNEMAKSHARYLGGGRRRVAHERLYEFQFPERPGALKRFLEKLPKHLNVSLFHYRNDGMDVGKVLVGLQGELEMFLSDVGYAHVDETDNPVYQQFLC